jgi:hypothetical protein
MHALRPPPARRAIDRAEWGDDVSATKLLAIALITAGILALVYGRFSYTRERHEAKLGPIELSVTDEDTVVVPVWVGVGAIVAGGALLLSGGRKR